MDQAYIVADEHRHGERDTGETWLSKVHSATAILKLRLRVTPDFGPFPAPLLLLHLLANTLPDTYHKWIRGAPSDLPKIYKALSPDVAPPLVRNACFSSGFSFSVY